MLCAAMGLAIGLPCASAHAQGPKMTAGAAAGDRDTSADTELLLAGDMIVTASKTAQRISDSPAAATVITADQIERSGATSIVELLRSVPGVDVMEPNKSQANVAIRGFNKIFSNQILVMVDGRSINQDIEGNVFWNTQPLLLSRIARIEVVRGPGSVLYGANAFGGVINIITKTPAELLAAQNHSSFAGAYGEHNSTFVEVATTQGKAGDWALTVGAGYHGTNGYGERKPSQIRDSDSVPIETLDLEKQTRRGSLTLSVDNSDATADLSVQALLDDAKWHTTSETLTYNEDKGATPIMGRIYHTSERLVNPTFGLNSEVINLEIQQQRQISARHQLLYGGSYRQGEFTSTPTGTMSHGQSLKSLFFQDQILIDSMTNLFAGVRWDDNSIYGSQTSPRLSLVRHLPKEQTVRLSYGTAFRAPTIIETYLNFASPLAPGLNFEMLGSTDLKPEKVTSIEAGYRKDTPSGYVGLSLFANHITDVISSAVLETAPSPPFPPNIPIKLQLTNIGGVRATGFELESGFRLGGGAHGLLNYAYQDVTNDDGSQADFSPHHKINLVLQTDDRRKAIGYLAAHFVSQAKYGSAPIRQYTTLDANLSYRVGGLSKPWTISLAATNLLDDRHEEYVDVLNPLAPSKIAESQRRTLWVRADGKF